MMEMAGGLFRERSREMSVNIFRKQVYQVGWVTPHMLTETKREIERGRERERYVE